ncbi:hypothetical protein FZC79_10475 [Rossellomorea vietnamensis]|uniref:Prophage pi2 protein 38 n=1 Tax=Rossellomorea vietnamensis TaxID=218284 RepID=A0A5D4KH79_9BACI|nr:hypothetical protein [Rossellomorea vietnamensis]TYR75583.1 hypothetical protein FZC79_10475 [Rossellomorea vietnamensis]
MTLIELKRILDAAGYPVAYSHFTESTNRPIPDPPFIVYLSPSTSNFFADDTVLKKINDLTVELYTSYKDLSAEQALEDVLEDNEIPWEANEVWIESEKMFKKTYEIGVI